MRGHICRGPATPDPHRRLLASVARRAVRDAQRGDVDAAAWLDDAAVQSFLAARLGVDVAPWRARKGQAQHDKHMPSNPARRATLSGAAAGGQ